MSWSTLPFGGFFAAAASSRIPFSRSFDASPAAHRRLHRGISAGIGFFARHAPFANS